MRATVSASARYWVSLLSFSLVACMAKPPQEPPLDIRLYQKWQLQPGDTIAGHEVVSGLGNISIALQGQSVYAPFNGKTQRDRRGCVLFSSPEVPGYLFRLCGLKPSKWGSVRSKEALGSGNLLQFAALRKQPDNSWAIVEPSKVMLEQTLKQP